MAMALDVCADGGCVAMEKEKIQAQLQETLLGDDHSKREELEVSHQFHLHTQLSVMKATRRFFAQ
jgi:hypothetical protein